MRYCARPAFALERLELLPDGRIAYRIKQPRKDGTHRILTPLELIARIAALIPPPPRRELHVILDNSSSHGTPAVRAWLAKNPRIHFHYTPTSASWLNQVEGFFGILGKQSLGVSDFPSKTALREHIDAYIAHWNDDPTPFLWTKPAAAIIKSHRKMLARISHALR